MNIFRESSETEIAGDPVGEQIYIASNSFPHWVQANSSPSSGYSRDCSDDFRFMLKNFIDLNEQPLVIVKGRDTINKSSFGHAMIMTECVENGKMIDFKLKNSLGGSHLKGTVSFAQIRSNKKIQLTQIKNRNPDFTWTMKCYLTLFVTF